MPKENQHIKFISDLNEI